MVGKWAARVDVEVLVANHVPVAGFRSPRASWIALATAARPGYGERAALRRNLLYIDDDECPQWANCNPPDPGDVTR